MIRVDVPIAIPLAFQRGSVICRHVPGYVVPDTDTTLAVHRVPHGWNVTHLPTGAGISHCFAKSRKIAAHRALLTYNVLRSHRVNVKRMTSRSWLNWPAKRRKAIEAGFAMAGLSLSSSAQRSEGA